MRIALLFLAACGGAPKWVDTCTCDEGLVCRDNGEDADWGAGAACVEPPSACDDVFLDPCDLDLLDDPCRQAICGDSLGAGFEADCYADDTSQWMRVDCDPE